MVVTGLLLLQLEKNNNDLSDEVLGIFFQDLILDINVQCQGVSNNK